MTLAEEVNQHPPEHVVWTGETFEYTSAALRDWISFARAQLANYMGKSVALSFREDVDLAQALVALDGFAAALLLIPHNAGADAADLYIKRCGSRYLLSDRNDLCLPSFPIPKKNLATATSASRQFQAFETRWIIPTSGTTGTSKLVSHSLDSLTRTVKRNKCVGGRIRWGLIYELARFAGLQVFFQSVYGGSTLIFSNQALPLDRMRSLSAQRCNAISATPTLWRQMLMAGFPESLRLDFISLGGEIADSHVLTALRRLFPQARISHIYASTEAGVGFSIADGLPGFPADFIHTPPSGVEVRVGDNSLLYLRAARQCQDYIGESKSLVEDGWINTGDVVQRSGERYLFLGRANGVINVGGNKVYPEEIEECVREVAGVGQVAIRARRNAFMGNLVEAFVVPADNFKHEALDARITQHCKGRLEPFKVPAVIHMVDSLELSSAGKIQR